MSLLTSSESSFRNVNVAAERKRVETNRGGCRERRLGGGGGGGTELLRQKS